jgi:hypothetical protein
MQGRFGKLRTGFDKLSPNGGEGRCMPHAKAMALAPFALSLSKGISRIMQGASASSVQASTSLY